MVGALSDNATALRFTLWRVTRRRSTLVPDWIAVDTYDRAVAQVASKKAPTRLGDLRFERLSEGRCVQTLHLGSFDDEGPVLARMHAEFIPENGLRMTGRHHEIYLSDFRKVAPEKLRTILRQPVAAV